MRHIYKFLVGYIHIIMLGLSAVVGFYCVQHLDNDIVIWYLSKLDDTAYEYLPWYKISLVTYLILIFIFGWYKIIKQFFVVAKQTKDVIN